MRDETPPGGNGALTWRQRVGFSLLFAVGIIAILGLAIYLRVATSYAQSPRATPVPPNGVGPAIPRADLVGRIVFKCDLKGGSGYCVANAEGQELVPLPGPASYQEALARETFSHDGSRNVYSAQYADGYNLFIRHVQSGWVDQLTEGTHADYAPVLTPDGNQVVFVRQDEQGSAIWVYDVKQRSLHSLTIPENWHDEHPSLSADGKQIIFWSDRDRVMSLYLMNIDGSNLHKLAIGDMNAWDPVWIKPAITGTGEAPPATSPAALGVGLTFDARRCELAVSAGDDSGLAPITRLLVKSDNETVYDSGDIQVSLHNASAQLGSRIGPRQITVQAWNTGAFTQQPFVLQRQVACAELSASDTGLIGLPTSTSTVTLIVVQPVPPPANVFEAATQVVAATRDAQLHGTATPTPKNVVTATPTEAPYMITPTPQPKNEATAVYLNMMATAVAVTTGTPTPLPDYVIIATVTQTPTPTTPPTVPPPATYTPVWVPWMGTPDVPRTPTATPVPPIPAVLKGRIMFKSNRDGEDQVFVINPDGSHLGKLTSSWPYQLALDREAVGGGGQFLLFVRTDLSAPQLFFHDFKYNVDKQLTRMGAGASWEGAFNPDGWRVAFVSNEPNNDEIYVVNRDGTGLTRLTKNTWEWDRHPSWSPDGSQIVFWSNRSGRKQLYVMTADGQNVHSISDGLADDLDPVWVK